MKSIRVITPNFKLRHSGVTSSMLSVLRHLEEKVLIAVIGYGVPSNINKLSVWSFIYNKKQYNNCIWHARRNNEMLIGIILKKLFNYNIKLVWTSAGQREHSRYTKFLYDRMDHVIATTTKAASYLKCKSTVINHGVNTKIFYPEKLFFNSSRYKIGIFGRVRPDKGVDLFVDVLCKLLQKYKQWDAFIIGKVTSEFILFKYKLIKKIEESKLGNRFFFRDLSFDETPKMYRKMNLVTALPQGVDISVENSASSKRTEGFGLTCLEAMASGCPVVATKAGAFPEIITNKKIGWLLDSRNEDNLTSVLAEAMSNVDRLREMGMYARKHIEKHFSIESEVSGILDVYSKLQEDT